jgi:hypothetical protein
MPHFDARARLASHVNGMLTQSSRSDVLSTLKHTRELLESTGLKRDFPTLSMYCNWYLHPVLAQAEPGWQVLVDINDVLCDASNPNPVAAIGAALRLETLRSQAIELFTSRQINPFLFIHDSNWMAFAFSLLHDCAGRPSIGQRTRQKNQASCSTR